MLNQMLDLHWEVPAAGYIVSRGSRWGKPEETEDFLVEAHLIISHTRRDVRRYSPLAEHTGLFHTFAYTPATPEGIVAFAQKYGALGGHTETLFMLQPVDRPYDTTKAAYGEPVQVWFSEMQKMHHAVTLWDLLRQRDVTGLMNQKELLDVSLNSYSVVSRDDSLLATRVGIGRERQVIDQDQQPVWGLGPVCENNVLIHAQNALQVILDEQLTRFSLETRVVRQDDGVGLGIKMLPSSLLHALWLQFAVAVAENKDFGVCEVCQTRFERNPDTGRKSRRFCSIACRSKFHRQQQQPDEETIVFAQETQDYGQTEAPNIRDMNQKQYLQGGMAYERPHQGKGSQPLRDSNRTAEGPERETPPEMA